jgi:hypothetical protein
MIHPISNKKKKQKQKNKLNKFKKIIICYDNLSILDSVSNNKMINKILMVINAITALIKSHHSKTQKKKYRKLPINYSPICKSTNNPKISNKFIKISNCK